MPFQRIVNIWRRLLFVCGSFIGRRSGVVDLSPAAFILGLAIYCGLYFSVGNTWSLGRECFALAALWAAALVIAQLAAWVKFPRAPAMVLSGLCLAQIPNSATLHLPPAWVGVIRALALSIALLMGGCELEFSAIWRLKFPAIAYMLLPLIAVVGTIAGVSHALAGMPILLGLSFGFILNAVSPGIIVPQMLSLASQGYGTRKESCIVAMLASIMDEVANLTGFAIFANMSLPRKEPAPLAWTIAKGPTEVVVGVAAGALLGLVCGCSRIWDTTVKRCMAVFVSVLMLMSVMHGSQVDMMTGGAIGALMIGLITPMMWEKGWPKLLSLGPREHYAHTLEHVTSLVWGWIFEPLLFGTIAYDIVFSQIEGATVVLAVAFIFIGQSVRFVSAFGTMKLLNHTWREAAFFAVAWMPKGTVQAALEGIVSTAAGHMPDGDPMKERFIYWGHLIKGSAALAVAIFATLGTLGIEKLSPLLLPREKTTLEQMEEELDMMNNTQQQHETSAAVNKDALETHKGIDQLHSSHSARPNASQAPSWPCCGLWGRNRPGVSKHAVPASRPAARQASLQELERISRAHNLRSFSKRAAGGQQQQQQQQQQSSCNGADTAVAAEAARQEALDAAQLLGGEHLRSTDELANLFVQRPLAVRQYFKDVHDLLVALADQPDILHVVPDAQRLANRISKTEELLYTRTPANARQLMRAANDLARMSALRQQLAFRACSDVEHVQQAGSSDCRSNLMAAFSTAASLPKDMKLHDIDV